LKIIEKYKEHKTKFDIPVFLYTVNVILSNDVVEARERLNTILGRWVNGHFEAMHSNTGGGTSYIILPFDADGRLIAHEAFHCVLAILRFLHSDGEEELDAYLLSYIVEKIESFQKKKGFRK